MVHGDKLYNWILIMTYFYKKTDKSLEQGPLSKTELTFLFKTQKICPDAPIRTQDSTAYDPCYAVLDLKPRSMRNILRFKGFSSRVAWLSTFAAASAASLVWISIMFLVTVYIEAVYFDYNLGLFGDTSTNAPVMYRPTAMMLMLSVPIVLFLSFGITAGARRLRDIGWPVYLTWLQLVGGIVLLILPFLMLKGHTAGVIPESPDFLKIGTWMSASLAVCFLLFSFFTFMNATGL